MRYLPLLLLIGCASTIKRARAKDIRFIFADPVAVSEHCKTTPGMAYDIFGNAKRTRVIVGKNDKGQPLTEKSVVRCCTHKRFGHSTIFVGEGNADCIVHEMRHAQGDTPEEADAVHMDDRYTGKPTGLFKKDHESAYQSGTREAQ